MMQLTHGVKVQLGEAENPNWPPIYLIQFPEFDPDIYIRLRWKRLRSWKSVTVACLEQLGQYPTWQPDNGWHWRAILAELLNNALVEQWYKVHPVPGVTIKRAGES